MSQYHPIKSYTSGIPIRKESNGLTSTTNKAKKTIQYTLSSVPTYTTYKTTQTTSTKAATVVTSSNPLQQSGVRYYQQQFNGVANQQTGDIGQSLTQKIIPIQQKSFTSQNTVNVICSPRVPTKNSELSSTIITNYKTQPKQSSSKTITSTTIVSPIKMISPVSVVPIIQKQETQIASNYSTAVYSSVQPPSIQSNYLITESPKRTNRGAIYTSEGSPLNLNSVYQYSSARKCATESSPYCPTYKTEQKSSTNYVSSLIAQQQLQNVANMSNASSSSQLNFANGISYSYNNLNSPNITKDNISKVPDQVSNKLIEEFQKLTETNLKFFMSNKQKWKHIEESLKHENEDLKNKINTLHDSYSQINKSINTKQPDVSFSLQKDLDLAHIYEQKISAIQIELERSQLELEEYKRKNEETQVKNNELNIICLKLNEKINSQQHQSQDIKIINVSENIQIEQKIEEIRKQYEIQIQQQQQLYNITIQNMQGQIHSLETHLDLEKENNKKLQIEVSNSSSHQLLAQQTLNQSSHTIQTTYIQTNENEIKKQYETMLAHQKEQSEQELAMLKNQISNLEISLSNQKQISNKLEVELQTICSQQNNNFNQSNMNNSVQINDIKQYEIILMNQKDQFSQQLQQMNLQISELEVLLTNEKFISKKLQNEVENLNMVNQEQNKVNEIKYIDIQKLMEEMKRQHEQQLLIQKEEYNQSLIKVNEQMTNLETHLTNEKLVTQKLQTEIQTVTKQNQINDKSSTYESEIQSLKEQIENLNTQNLKINQQNMELTQTQLEMAQIANQNNKFEELQNEIENLKIQNEQLTVQNQQILSQKEQEIDEQAKKYRQIIQEMKEQEEKKEKENDENVNDDNVFEEDNISIIPHPVQRQERQEREVRNQGAKDLIKVMYESSIEESNETVKQLQQQLENKNTLTVQKNQRLNISQDTPDNKKVQIKMVQSFIDQASVIQSEQTLIQEIVRKRDFINDQNQLRKVESLDDVQQEEQNQKEQQLLKVENQLKEEQLQKEQKEKILLQEELIYQSQVFSEKSEQFMRKSQEFEQAEYRYKKHISEIESKLFLIAKDSSDKRQNIDDLEKSMKSLCEKVFSYEEKEKYLYKQLNDYKELLQKLQDENQFKGLESERINSVKQSEMINQYEMLINQLKSELSQSSNEYTIKISTIEQTHNSDIQQYNSQIQYLNSQMMGSVKQLEEKQKKNEEFSEMTKKLEQRLLEMVNEREELLKSDKDKESQSQQLKEIIEKEYKNKMDGYINTIKQQEEEISSQKSLIQSQTEDSINMSKQYQELENILKETIKKKQEVELQFNSEKQQLQESSYKSQYELKSQVSLLESTITEKNQSEFIIKSDLEKYQNQLALIASQLGQKESQLTLYKKENQTLSNKILEIEGQYDDEMKKIKSQVQELEKTNQDLEQKHEKQVKTYEKIKSEKEENDIMGNEEIQKLKLNYEALLESEKTSKEEIEKKQICQVDQLKIQIARSESKSKTNDENHQKQIKNMQKEIDGFKSLNDKKLETMKLIQEENKKLQEQQKTIDQQMKRKELKYEDEIKSLNSELEAVRQDKKKIIEQQENLQKQYQESNTKIESLIEIQEKLSKELTISEEKRATIEKQWTTKHQSTIQEYESKIVQKNSEFEKILSTKQGDSSSQIQEFTQKIMKYEMELREKENIYNIRISELESSVKEQQSRSKSLEEEKLKVATQFQDKLNNLNKEMENLKISIKENSNKIESLEKELKEKIQIIKNLEIEIAELEEKNFKYEEKLVFVSTQLEQTKLSKKDTEDRLQKTLKEKEVEQHIIADDYDQKIKLYKQTIEQLQNQQQGDVKFVQELKYSQIAELSKNNSRSNSIESNEKLNEKELGNKMAGKSGFSPSEMSINSHRSKDETRDMYRKLSYMSMATAAMMSVKHDYVSLKELARSTNNVSPYKNSQEDIDPRLTKSDAKK